MWLEPSEPYVDRFQSWTIREYLQQPDQFLLRVLHSVEHATLLLLPVTSLGVAAESFGHFLNYKPNTQKPKTPKPQIYISIKNKRLRLNFLFKKVYQSDEIQTVSLLLLGALHRLSISLWGGSCW